MSIPPGPPPGGYYATPPRKSGVNGWAIAGFGCLTLFLLATVAGFLLVRATKDQLAHPSKSSPLGIGILVGHATVDGAKLASAIVAYHQDKGHYPQSLTELVTENRIDGKLLHNDLDDNPNPGHISWKYTKPDEGAPGSTPVLEEPYQMTVGGTSQPSSIIVPLEGRGHAGTPSRRQTPESQTP